MFVTLNSNSAICTSIISDTALGALLFVGSVVYARVKLSCSTVNQKDRTDTDSKRTPLGENFQEDVVITGRKKNGNSGNSCGSLSSGNGIEALINDAGASSTMAKHELPVCQPATITVVYASTTGTSEALAAQAREILVNQLWATASGFTEAHSTAYSTTTPITGSMDDKAGMTYDVQCRDMETFDWFNEFINPPLPTGTKETMPPILLLILPTYTNGAFPPKAQPFHNALQRLANDWRIPPQPLKATHLHVAILGIGNTQFGVEGFCRPCVQVHDIMVGGGGGGVVVGKGLGALSLCQGMKIDLSKQGSATKSLLQKQVHMWIMDSVIPAIKRTAFSNTVSHGKHYSNGSNVSSGSDIFVPFEYEEREPSVADLEDLGAKRAANGDSIASSTCAGNGCCSSLDSETITVNERLPGSSASRVLPDYNTPVQIDKIRLSKVTKYRRKDLDGQTLVEKTLQEMDTDVSFQETAHRLKTLGAKGVSMEERKQRRRALNALGIPDFHRFVESKLQEENRTDDSTQRDVGVIIRRSATHVFQWNIGLYCNQACSHCHVESSPKRAEMMSFHVARQCLLLLRNSPEVTTLDITGGAPELNKTFRFIVHEARAIRPDIDIIDRCNLTVLHEPGQDDLAGFLKEHGVHIIASLPCYSAKNVNQQRGSGVFDRSISALLKLNEVGYGSPEHPELQLDLVYNPLGAFLPPPQAKLESQYKKQLDEHFGIVFNRLFTMTNMPIKRFADFLHKRGELQAYMDLLVRNFNLDTINSIMCINTISVGYDGKIFDCDFNQQLGLSVGGTDMHEGGKDVFSINKLSDLSNDRIFHDNHCFGCTAGMGSS